MKTHQCPQCPKVFTGASHVKRHMLVHSGEKTHQCPECGKRFRTRGHVKTHMLVHSRDKPHECPECGKDLCNDIFKIGFSSPFRNEKQPFELRNSSLADTKKMFDQKAKGHTAKMAANPFSGSFKNQVSTKLSRDDPNYG
ncbi:gastrula zinc finger protein XlCGF67.1-like, partial [Procambarus clarkii]|uniref:gastrula zinc finger protein XlCGF67.1-like n=1 Tax=Procambarus clarkii TaxID=6728 RepID=UPI0037443856